MAKTAEISQRCRQETIPKYHYSICFCYISLFFNILDLLCL